WFLICDDLRKDASPHAWDWLLHTSQLNEIDLGGNPVQLSHAGATCDVYFAHPAAASLALSWAPWVHRGVDPATARIVAHTYDVGPRFAVALVPRGAGRAAPAYTASDDGTTTALALDWGSTQDAAVFDPSHTMSAGRLATDGRVALVRDTQGAT